MLVRDNICCPNCGKLTAIDFDVKSGTLSSDCLTIRYECTNCLAFCDREIPLAVIRCVLWALSRTRSPTIRSTLKLVRRWSIPSHKKLSRLQAWRTRDLLDDLFSKQIVCERNSTEQEILLALRELIISPSGCTFHLLGDLRTSCALYICPRNGGECEEVATYRL